MTTYPELYLSRTHHKKIDDCKLSANIAVNSTLHLYQYVLFDCACYSLNISVYNCVMNIKPSVSVDTGRQNQHQSLTQVGEKRLCQHWRVVWLGAV